ncbi:MAG: peptidase M15 [Alistipes sp.]|jgi:hypothetical protein|nr:peptidase M15 [Alistipes sp.]
MSKYFTLNELFASATAAQQGIDNTPPADTEARLNTLTEKLLDPVRELWDAPLTVNSGYRSPALNRAVGGAARSQHLTGEAADITTGSRAGNRLLFNMIVAAAGLSPPPKSPPNRPPLVIARSAATKQSSRVDLTAANPEPLPETPPKPQLIFDQLIDERNYSWLHLSYRTGRNRQQVLHLR